MRIRIYILHLYIYICIFIRLYRWIAICKESIEENGNHYTWVNMYKRQYICREKERGYLQTVWNSKRFLVLVFFSVHYPVLRDPLCKWKEALKLYTCFNLRMWGEFRIALLFLWAKPINYYPNPFSALVSDKEISQNAGLIWHVLGVSYEQNLGSSYQSHISELLSTS